MLFTNLAGWLGPSVSTRTRNITNVAITACSIVINSIVANFVKKVTWQKSMTIAAVKVVAAAARIDGPMWIKAYFVRSFRDSSPVWCL